MKDNNTFIKNIIKKFIRKIFRIHEFLTSIMFD